MNEWMDGDDVDDDEMWVYISTVDNHENNEDDDDDSIAKTLSSSFFNLGTTAAAQVSTRK